MKKNTIYKINIARSYALAILVYIIFLTIIVTSIIKFVPNENIGIQWIILSPMFAFLPASPFILRAENVHNHFKSLLKKEEKKAL